MKHLNKFVSGLLTVLMGVMLIVLKGEVINIALTVFGIAFIVIGAINLFQKMIAVGVIKIILGVVALYFGWFLISIALYVMGALLVLYGILQFLELLKSKKKTGVIAALLRILPPVISVLAGLCLLFNQGGAISWVFIVSGVFLIIEGVLTVLGGSKK